MVLEALVQMSSIIANFGEIELGMLKNAYFRKIFETSKYLEI